MEVNGLHIDHLTDRKEINLVWMKRDIRTQDHLPLQLAESNSLPYLIVLLLEPSIISYPDNTCSSNTIRSYRRIRKSKNTDSR